MTRKEIFVREILSTVNPNKTTEASKDSIKRNFEKRYIQRKKEELEKTHFFMSVVIIKF